MVTKHIQFIYLFTQYFKYIEQKSIIIIRLNGFKYMFYFKFIFRLALAIPTVSDGPSKCTMYDVNYTNILANGIKTADPSWPTKRCDNGWEFDHSEIPYTTIATEV